jgi:transposase
MDNQQTALYPDLELAQGSSGPGDSPCEKRRGEPRLEVVNRQQMQFRVVEVERLIAEDHPARAIWEFVGRLDLSGYYREIRSVEGVAGRPGWDPQLLISLWIYSYSQGVGSARAIARLCESDPAYQWLTGMEVVNAHTLSDFRVEHEEALQGVFAGVLGVLSAEGLIKLERVTQDGTKVQAAAGSNSFRTQERIEQHLEAARELVAAVQEQGEEGSSRQMIQARQRARRERQQRLESALQEFEALGSKKGGSKKSKERVSTTDPQARIMKQKDGGFAPSYNVQISTDTANGVIVGVEATQAGNDFDQLVPAVERVQEAFGKVPEQVVADGGYVNRDNIVAMAEAEVEFIGPACDEKGKGDSSYAQRGVAPEYRAEAFVYDAATDSYRCPQGKVLLYEGKDQSNQYVSYRYRAQAGDCRSCPAKGQCCQKNHKTGRSIQRKEDLREVAEFRDKMQTDAMREIYRQRSQIAEFPNLWIKAKLRLRQFAVRGLRKVGMECLWACLTYNIQQWIRLRWRPSLVVAAASS